MESHSLDDLTIVLNKEGARTYTKVSYPIRYGRFAEIRTQDHIFQFNLNGEIKHIQGQGHNWPHPTEWLKRTVGNDWIYYSAGDYKGIYELFGEYYFPCLSYPSNAIMGENPFENEAITSAIRAWRKFQERVSDLGSTLASHPLKRFLSRITQQNDQRLAARAEELHQILGGHITVLPPDTRHVDYEVIPLIVADGCLYNCGFCRVKSNRGFQLRRPEDILAQIMNLRCLYGDDLPNYNAVFLGEHDALRAGRDVIEFSASKAYELFGLEHSHMREVRLFLFGSAHSVLQSEDALFECLNNYPYYTYINVGLESADPATLTALRKPIGVELVREAFARMMDINRRYDRIEITANFLLSDRFPLDHFVSLAKLVDTKSEFPSVKGGLYLSPLVEGRNEDGAKRRRLLKKFYEIKVQSPLPAYLYLIQRL
jgi:hypothetical protein